MCNFNVMAIYGRLVFSTLLLEVLLALCYTKLWRQMFCIRHCQQMWFKVEVSYKSNLMAQLQLQDNLSRY